MLVPVLQSIGKMAREHILYYKKSNNVPSPCFSLDALCMSLEVYFYYYAWWLSYRSNICLPIYCYCVPKCNSNDVV